MSTSKLNTERLQEFAHYLSTEELKSLEIFKPGISIEIDEADDFETQINVTLFIALFELPHIFPDDWVYSKHFEPVLKKKNRVSSFEAVQLWFGLSELQFEHLFFPGMQLCGMFGGRIFDFNSGKRDLVFNINELIRMSRFDKTSKTEGEFRICLN